MLYDGGVKSRLGIPDFLQFHSYNHYILPLLRLSKLLSVKIYPFQVSPETTVYGWNIGTSNR